MWQKLVPDIRGPSFHYQDLDQLLYNCCSDWRVNEALLSLCIFATGMVTVDLNLVFCEKTLLNIFWAQSKQKHRSRAAVSLCR